jgi:hypothetical protein
VALLRVTVLQQACASVSPGGFEVPCRPSASSYIHRARMEKNSKAAALARISHGGGLSWMCKLLTYGWCWVQLSALLTPSTARSSCSWFRRTHNATISKHLRPYLGHPHSGIPAQRWSTSGPLGMRTTQATSS